MIGFGVEKIGYESPNQPLTLGGEWVVFANETGAKMAAMMLEALICEEFKVVDLGQRVVDSEKQMWGERADDAAK